jgi:hypothetical protein
MRLLTDRTLHDRLAGGARQTAKDRFCDEKIVPTYEAYYREILAAHPSP